MSEFVLVGGGVYGVGLAHRLAQAGAEVRLLEARTVASGASGGPGKRGVRANGRDRRELPLMRLAYELWPGLHEIIGAPTHYERTGHLLLYERAEDLGAAPAMVWMQEQQGVSSRIIHQEELLGMEPRLSRRISAATFCPNDGVADHTATTLGYAQAARSVGARIDEHTRVIDLELAGSKVVAAHTEQGERLAVHKEICLLANSGVAEILERCLRLTLPIWRSAFQVLITAPVDPFPLRHLIGHASRVLSMKRHGEDRVMISGGWRGRWNDATGRGETVPDAVAANLAEAVAVCPDLEGIRIVESDATRLEASCIDGIPIIGRVPGIDNLTIVTGGSGHGWAIAPAVVKLLAEWLLGGPRSALLVPFGYERFCR